MASTTHIEFVVNHPPIAQPRVKVGRPKRQKFARAYVPKNHPIHAFRQAVALAAKQAMAGKGLMQGPLKICLTIYLPMTARMRAKKQPIPRQWHWSSPDADNILKGVQDAIVGGQKQQPIVCKDDGQFCSGHWDKVYITADEEPRCEVRIDKFEVAPDW